MARASEKVGEVRAEGLVAVGKAAVMVAAVMMVEREGEAEMVKAKAVAGKVEVRVAAAEEEK